MSQAAEPEPERGNEGFLEDVLEGLSAPQKFLQAKYFYDERGSRIYGEITRLPEYYPTRTETALMHSIAGELAEVCAGARAVVEFGSGSGERSRILLSVLPSARQYVPIDVSPQLLEQTRGDVAAVRPDMSVVPLVGDFSQALDIPPNVAKARLGFFPGSTIGNFLPGEARQFLENARRTLGAGSRMLVGADLVKPATVLEPAYDDAAGVTARFNRNLLHRINRELDADFDLDAFSHRAFYNSDKSRVEMHLVSQQSQKVRVNGTASFRFEAGETIHTENSHKFTVDGFRELAGASGWVPLRHWVDENGLFSVHLLEYA